MILRQQSPIYLSIKTNKHNMKKVIFTMLVAGTMMITSCGQSTKTEETQTTADSTSVATDSTKISVDSTLVDTTSVHSVK